MTTVSYPAVGNDGFNEAQWAEYFDGEDGIVNDYTGGSLLLSRVNTGDIARYAVGQVRVAGYDLKITVAHDLAPIPTAAGTYYTWACYDPALNVADGSGDADPLGPVRLGFSTGLPSTAGGKQYFLLDKIVRAASQALSSATVTNYRRWLGPNVTCNVMPAGELAFPRVQTTGWGPYPVGTSMFESTTGITYRLFVPDEFLEWVSSGGKPVPFPLAGTLVAVDTAVPEYLINNGHCYLQGDIKRSNGNPLVTAAATTDVILGTLPFGPAHLRRFNCYGSSETSAFIYVAASGVVSLFAGGQSITYIDLSGAHFQIGA